MILSNFSRDCCFVLAYHIANRARLAMYSPDVCPDRTEGSPNPLDPGRLLLDPPRSWKDTKVIAEGLQEIGMVVQMVDEEQAGMCGGCRGFGSVPVSLGAKVK